ncbi:MAG: acetyl-CoA carboxylase biotin carboxyl carrier protein [Candidatus Neomarinimicrobiota bacterium]|nr:MAG: acetyl-CoA carboxylase biotin carboxyl carrier protein [Candidatus Neomarinimicrobiota bacterium]
MKSAKILELVKILESHNITEIEVSRWGSKIRIAKMASGRNTPETVNIVSEDVNKSAQPQFVEVASISETQPKVSKGEEEKGIEIKTPIVGTFYKAPSPEADPYVKVGDHISVGQALCVIEAMKIMNVIESEVSGKIVKELVENAQPVEYNQTLFLVEPS